MASGELALPNENGTDSYIENDRPAYVTEATDHAGRSLEDIDLNQYWDQPNGTTEEIKPDINDLNEVTEDIATGVAEAGRIKGEREENEERINALNEPECADHCDPPESHSEESGENLNGHSEGDNQNEQDEEDSEQPQEEAEQPEHPEAEPESEQPEQEPPAEPAPPADTSGDDMPTD